ncbi:MULTISPECIES: ABC transporter permease subunit [Streptomyces]|uniref:ABC transporter permease subunit n=1 Tax=Streptomyces TaxID=1883 RepID=UPI001B326ACD|nr:ABC transporter permease [Streptomyces sp. AgN23]AJZ82789.2 ABC transporter permease subunit [Streptomyces sp. AgN23]
MTTPYQHQSQAPVPPQGPQGPPQGPPQTAPQAAPQMPPQAPHQAAPHQAAPHHPAPQAYQQPVPSGPPSQPYAGMGPYTSPIPVRRTHLGNALASEWTKIKSVRSTIWTLGIMAALVLGIGLLVSATTNDADYRTLPTTLPGFFGTLLGQLCIVTLGVLVITSEYGTGMIRTTLTASPQRSRVLTAKALVFFALSFTTTTVSLALVAYASMGMHSGPEVTEPTSDQILGATVGAGLYVSLLGLLSLAVGAILRHSAGAITTMLGVVLLPAILPAFLMMSDSLRDLGRKMLEYSSPQSLASLFRIDEGLNSGWPQLSALAVVTAAAMIAAYALLEKRDV